MYPLGIKVFLTGQGIEITDDLRSFSRSLARSYHSEMIAPVTDLHPEALLNLSEVFVELAAKISQQVVIGGFQQELSGFYCSVQKLNGFRPRIVRPPPTQAVIGRVMNWVWPR